MEHTLQTYKTARQRETPQITKIRGTPGKKIKEKTPRGHPWHGGYTGKETKIARWYTMTRWTAEEVEAQSVEARGLGTSITCGCKNIYLPRGARHIAWDDARRLTHINIAHHGVTLGSLISHSDLHCMGAHNLAKYTLHSTHTTSMGLQSNTQLIVDHTWIHISDQEDPLH